MKDYTRKSANWSRVICVLGGVQVGIAGWLLLSVGGAGSVILAVVLIIAAAAQVIPAVSSTRALQARRRTLIRQFHQDMDTINARWHR